MASSDKSNDAGLTGSIGDQAEDVRKMAKTATAAVKREAQAVATGVSDHPHAAASMLVAVGAVAFGLGYLLGRSSGAASRGYWG